MRYAIFVLLLTLCSDAFGAPVRVYQKPDGSIAVVHWATESREEPEALRGLAFVDMDSSQLPPDRQKRNKWRLNASNQIIEDDTVVDPEEVRKQRRESAKSKLRGLGLSNAEVQALTND